MKITIGQSRKAWFFDREAVLNFMDKKTASALARGGGFIRRVAQNSMRARKGPSAAGSPPSRHLPRGDGLTNIQYSFDPVTKLVVIGPVIRGSMTLPGGLTIPQLHEFGADNVQMRPQRRRRGLRESTPVAAAVSTYPARPFMEPALEKAAPKIPELWASAVQS